METPNRHHQEHFFVQLPDLNVPTKTLTLTSSPSLTLRQLELLSLPQTLTLEKSLHFTLNGKPLPDSSPLPPSSSTLSLRLPLPGGGGATGAESRYCYLNMYASKKRDPTETRLSKWTTCALSGQPLYAPVIIDHLSSLASFAIRGSRRGTRL